MRTIKGDRIKNMEQDKMTNAELIRMICRFEGQVNALDLEIRRLQSDLRIAFGLCTLLALTGLLGVLC